MILKPLGYDRVWIYENNDIIVRCQRIGNTVDSWAIAYFVSSYPEYYVEFRGESPLNIIEGSFIYVDGKRYEPIITKVDPIPVAKYYNVLVDFKGTPGTSFGQESFILTLVDISKTGTDREWIYENRIQNDDGTEYINGVRLEKSSKAESVWQMYYLYTFYDGKKANTTVVWYGYINCENPWEATSDQIISDNGYIPKLSGIHVLE